MHGVRDGVAADAQPLRAVHGRHGERRPGSGLELAGWVGARLAGRLGITVRSSTILRLLVGFPEREAGTAPEILGVDDFALRKGHVHGTLLVDMETGGVVDMLADREAATVEAGQVAPLGGRRPLPPVR